MSLNLEVVTIVLLIIYLESVLSIDNAAVLGAMVSGLPEKQVIPWPRPLQFLTNPIHRLFGGQRSAALKVGLLGAYFGRGLMLLFATYIIQNPWLRVLGGLYLVKLAFENLGEPEYGEEEQVDFERVTRKGFWTVVLNVELADLAFSLDNVVAVVALSNNFWLVMFGVGVGILAMRFAAGIFTVLIKREPILKPAAYVLVLNIGVELLLEDLAGIHIATVYTFSISVVTLLLALVYAHVKPLRVIRPVFLWLGEGMADVNEVVNWLFRPLGALVKIIIRAARALWQMVRVSGKREPARESLAPTSPHKKTP
ncbi:MAG: tellurium resistance protein TerC [Chloroflexi bacterium]|nr:tellurium resistance protein TerC [Chloroflexota bacterium]